MAAERVLTVGEVAQRLRVSTATVTNWLREGRLRGYRIGGTKAGWRIEDVDLERFIAERKGERTETATEERLRENVEHQELLEEERRRIRGEEPNP